MLVNLNNLHTLGAVKEGYRGVSPKGEIEIQQREEDCCYTKIAELLKIPIEYFRYTPVDWRGLQQLLLTEDIEEHLDTVKRYRETHYIRNVWEILFLPKVEIERLMEKSMEQSILRVLKKTFPRLREYTIEGAWEYEEVFSSVSRLNLKQSRLGRVEPNEVLSLKIDTRYHLVTLQCGSGYSHTYTLQEKGFTSWLR